MPNYLKLDGVDDYLQTPSMTYDTIEMDVTPYEEISNNRWRYLFDARPAFGNGYIATSAGKAPSLSVGSWSGFWINGESKTINATTVGLMLTPIRKTLKFTLPTKTGTINFLNNSTLSEPMSADLYAIRMYNAGVLVGNYDMSTGTVRDQSGNGKHATLTGGSWADTTITEPIETEPTVINRFLKMDGVNDYIATPVGLAYNTIEIDFEPLLDNNGSEIIDARTSSGTTSGDLDYRLMYVENGGGFRAKTGVKEFYKDGASNPIDVLVPSTAGERTTVKIVFKAVITNNTSLFTYIGRDGSYHTKGNVYSLKFYNGATLVAHYDMSKGSLQDQSGNNNHGILFGGTFVNPSTPAYLQMDGVDDKLEPTTNSAFSEATAIYDVLINNSNKGKARWIQRGAGNVNFGFNTNGTVNFGNIDSAKINGVSVTSGTTPFPFGERITIELNYSSRINSWANLVFVDYGGTANFVEGNIYSIKYISLAGDLLAHYDTSFGNVRNQTGKGKDAILTGGIFVGDYKYEISVTTKEYCEKTMAQGFSNVSQVYDATKDSCYVTSNGGWLLNDENRYKYQLEPNTVYTIMDDTLLSTADGGIIYTSDAVLTTLESGYSSKGYYRVVRTNNIGKFGFYFSYELLPRHTHPIILKGYYMESTPRNIIYANAISKVIKIGEYRLANVILPVYSLESVLTEKQFRIYHPTKGIGCFELVPTTDSKASAVRVRTNTETKAIKKE